MKQILLLLIILHFQNGFSQEISLKGKLTAATVDLDEALVAVYGKDTVLLGTTFSDKSGYFSIDIPGVDSVFLKIEHEKIGSYTSGILATNKELNLDCSSENEIEEVVIAAKKPMIEKKQGMFVVNVDQMITASGSSAFEVLELSPGVRINSKDIISLNGKSGIAVQINGKMLPMSGTELANYLKGIPSSTIEKIECIHSPSSKYDAAGAAIINIVLKKDAKIGTNGSYAGTLGQGVYPKTSHAVSLNHRSKNVSLSANYSYSYRKAFNDLQLNRHFYSNDTFVGSYIQKNYFSFPVQNHSPRLGADFTGKKNTSYGISFTGISNSFTRLGNNISDVINSQHQLASRFGTYSKTSDNWLNGSSNLYWKKVLDTLGSFISFDADAAGYGNTSNQLFITNYTDPQGQAIAPDYILTGKMKGLLTIFSLKTDYTKYFKKNQSLEAGLKSSRVVADNDLRFFNESSGTAVYDSTKSNHFIYTEHIHAAYSSYRREWSKFQMQLGLRAEMTQVTGNQLTTGQKRDTSYLQLFPTGFFTYQLSDKHQLELAIGRRIDRPSYDQLNPFKFYLDPSTYRAGNPYLRPQTTISSDLTYLFKQNYSVTLSTSVTHNNITEIIAPSSTAQNLTVQTDINLKRAVVYSIAVNAPIEWNSWAKTNVSITGYYANYTGNAARTNIQNHGSPVGDVSVINSFTLPKNWTLEWNGYYHTKEVYAFDSIRSYGQMGFGIQKKMKEGKILLKMALSDAFYTSIIRADVTFTDYRESFKVRRESRVATVSFTYKFGKASVQASRRRAGGAEDLKSRVNTGAG